MSKQNKSDEMSPEELQALSLPILGTYEEDETFALKPEEQAKEFPPHCPAQYVHLTWYGGAHPRGPQEVDAGHPTVRDT